MKGWKGEPQHPKIWSPMAFIASSRGLGVSNVGSNANNLQACHGLTLAKCQPPVKAIHSASPALSWAEDRETKINKGLMT